MEFSGKLLKRGFWLYVWDIKGNSRHLYVGRTGDSSSANASSPFRRIGQHLDTRLNAKGNALGRQLRSAGIEPESCTFEMTAIGPIFAEQASMLDHEPLRDKTAALEKALALELRRRGYSVLGTHSSRTDADPALFQQVLGKLDSTYPGRRDQASRERFQPIALRGEGPTASEIILSDRERF